MSERGSNRLIIGINLTDTVGVSFYAFSTSPFKSISLLYGIFHLKLGLNRVSLGLVGSLEDRFLQNVAHLLVVYLF